MLKVLEDLERAVGRLVEMAGNEDRDSSSAKSTAILADPVVANLESVHTDSDNEEAAELIRRAIKRLRSL